MFVAVGHNGQRIASKDGSAWANLQSGKEGEVYRAVAYGKGRFVAAGSFGGSNIFAHSTDGATWQTANKEAKYVNYIRGMGFANNLFVGLGGDPGSVGDSKPFVVTSEDGVVWSDYARISGKNILRRFAFGNGVYVGVGDRGRRSFSRDLKEWKDVAGVKAVETLVDVCFGKNVFVGVGLHGLRISSADGETWSAPVRGEEGEHLNSVLWAGDRFVAAGAGATYMSPDGANWKREPNSDAPLTMTFGKGVFVGVNWKGRILLSSDAIHWKEVHKCEHHLETVTFGE